MLSKKCNRPSRVAKREAAVAIRAAVVGTREAAIQQVAAATRGPVDIQEAEEWGVVEWAAWALTALGIPAQQLAIRHGNN